MICSKINYIPVVLLSSKLINGISHPSFLVDQQFKNRTVWQINFPIRQYKTYLPLEKRYFLKDRGFCDISGCTFLRAAIVLAFVYINDDTINF